jgi:type III secretory pathway component EscU
MNWKKFTFEQIQVARETVANDWIELGYAIRKEDGYASYVTEETKDEQLAQMLESAEQKAVAIIERGQVWP